MSIGAVVVTFNRLDKLKIALECFDKQVVPCEYILVVNNASTDGTGEYLALWEKQGAAYKKIVVNMDCNTGGSGGFYEGLKRAQDMEAEWIWVSDDDAYPELEAIQRAEVYLEANKGDWKNIAAICAKVMNFGKIDFDHRKSLVVKGLKIKEVLSTEIDYKKPAFEINDFSYVGTILNKEKLKKVGLPNKDYFIWYDDTEHSMRMSKVGKIIVVPNVVVHHDLIDAPGPDYSWKTYYGLRNEWDMWRKHFPSYCFWYDVLQTRYRIFSRKLRGKRLEETALTEAALEDALAGRFGLHAFYRPGWKPQEK